MGTNNKGFTLFSLKDPQLRRLAVFIALGLLGVTLIVLGNVWQKPTEPPNTPSPGYETTASPTSTVTDPAAQIIELQEALEASLERILGQIDGVGKIAVRVTLSGAEQVFYEHDSNSTVRTTEEHDAQGGTRVTTERTESGELVVLRTQSTGSETPVISQVLRPEVTGVLVVAQGAGNSIIKSQLAEAVQTLLEVPAHRVQVLPMKGDH